MKYLCYAAVLTLLLQSCKKESGDNNQAPADSFINTAAGSSWTYHEINTTDGTTTESDYTITSTPNDTTINGRVYHVYAYSFGGHQYLNKSGNDYYEYADFAELGQSIERLYLKGGAKAGASWAQEVNLPVPDLPITVKVKITNEVADIGDRTVNGTLYHDVVHVKSSITSPDIPAGKLTSDIHSYFAPKFGLIENSTKIKLDYFVIDLDLDVRSSLIASDLK